MSRLDALEAAKGGPFTYRYGGEVLTGPDPVDMHFQRVLAALEARTMPLTPSMPLWQHDLLFERWRAHYDLPTAERAKRLCWLVDKYHDALEYDLHTRANGISLAQAWRERRWRWLLNAIDHLPRDTWYGEAVADDPEYAAAIIKAIEEGQDDGPKDPRPPLHTWTPEMGILADVVTMLRHVRHAVYVAGGAKDLPQPEPYPHPETEIDRARKRAAHRRRQERHNALAARLLPHKRRAQEPE